ncbi:uncharacterized protein LOC141609522 isoform X1 [Silene latifolia]|uniref:uncharacterized protein LOC141609522 isoform X1 n=2 Tax=Silene latifolia TaxID=37657 RepID=UPI003D788812
MPPILSQFFTSPYPSSCNMASEFERPRITEINVRMDCNGCVQKIKKALHGLNGIHELYIDVPQQKLTIIGRADPQRIMKAIKKVRKVATLCSHTEVPDPNSQPTEPTQDGGAPPPEGEAPPAEGPALGDAQPQPAEPPRSEEAPPPAPAPPPPPPQEPPNEHPPPTQPPQQESNPTPGQADMQPSHPSGSAGPGAGPGPSDADEEEEVHVTYHNPHDNGRRYGYGYGYGHGYGPGYRDNYGNPWSSQPGPSFGYSDRPRPVYHEPGFHEQRRPVYSDPPTRPFYHEPPGPPPRDVYYERLTPQTRYHEPPPPRARYHDPPPPPPPRAVYHEQPPQQVYATQSYNMYRPAPSVTQYHYAQSPPRYTPRHRTDYYYDTDSYQYDSTSSGNVPSIFSDENPNSCTIV